MENRWGKLPYTIYPKIYTSQVKLNDYDMSKPPGRTYRYYSGTPLFEYGQGLSYTTFAMQCKCSSGGSSGGSGGGGSGGGGSCTAIPMNFSCTVSNTGAVAGDEVVMVFHQAGDAMRHEASHPVCLVLFLARNPSHLLNSYFRK